MDSESYSIPRRYQRITVAVPVTIMVENERGRKVPQTMRMVDVSDHGLRLRGPTGLFPGQALELIPSEGPQYAMQGRVMWGNLLPGSQEAEFGVELVDPFPTGTWGPEKHATQV